MADFRRIENLIKSPTEKAKEVDEIIEKSLNAEQLKSLSFNPEEKFIVENLIVRNGINLFSGFYASGKTTLLLYFSKLILEGQFYHFKVFPGNYKIFYLGEDPKEIIGEKLRLMNFNSENFYYSNESLFLDDDMYIAQLSYLLVKNNFNILIVDPLRKFFKGDENKSSDVRHLTENVRKYLCNKGITFIFTHHWGKGSTYENNEKEIFKKPKSLSSRGSSDIGASADMVYTIIRIMGKEGFEILLSQDKNRLGSEIKNLKFDFTDWNNIVCLDYSISQTLKEKFRKEFETAIKNEEDFSLSREEALQIAKSLGLSLALFQVIIRELKDEGKIEPRKRGRHVVYYWIKTDEL
jgi:RecA-family ATPase